MRKSCACCARKHVAQAHVLLLEGQLGYPEHSWLAIGHLAEAEDETIQLWPEIANAIRDVRKLIMDQLNADQPPGPDLLPFITVLTEKYREQAKAAS